MAAKTCGSTTDGLKCVSTNCSARVCAAKRATSRKVAAGISDNLITRAAAVALKERRTLILVPRDTPLSPIALENLLKLANAGAIILPAMPGFYHRPKTIQQLVDFVVARILDRLGQKQDLVEPWKGMPAGKG